MKRSIWFMLVFGLFCVILTGCGSDDEAKIDQSNHEATVKGEDNMRILVQGEQGETIIFELNDSTAALSLYNQLPMTVDVEDYGDHEKIFYPFEKLDIQDTPLAKGPAGTLAYYEAWGDVVMYKGDCNGASGLYALGEAIEGESLIRQLNGTITISKYSKNQEQEQKDIKDEENVNQSDGLYPIRITAGDEVFEASLYDNATVREFMEYFPMSITMSDLHGNEKYYYFSDSLVTEPENTTQIHTGDLKLFGSDCLVLFYKDFSTTYSYTPLGKIYDPQGFTEALGSGSIEIRFELLK